MPASVVDRRRRRATAQLAGARARDVAGGRAGPRRWSRSSSRSRRPLVPRSPRSRRARASTPRARARSAAAQVLRRLLSLRDVADVADAFTSELRERLPLRAVGLRLIDEPEHWTPERPPEHATLDERALVLGDTGLGTLWLWLERPLRADELALLDLCCDHAPPAFGLARMRASLREARLAQAALVRAAETVGGELDLEVLLGKLAAASARMLGADAAAVWVHDATSEHNRVAATYGFDDDLQGQRFPAGAGAAGAAIAGLRPVQRSGGEPDAVSHPSLEEVRRELAVPVRWGRRGRAALVIAAFADGGAFGLAEIELASALARLASLALENAEAFAERGRQARLDRVASLVASELAPDPTSRTRSRRSRARRRRPSRPIVPRCATARACPSSRARRGRPRHRARAARDRRAPRDRRRQRLGRCTARLVRAQAPRLGRAPVRAAVG